MSITRKQLLELHTALSTKARGIMEAKNRDYAGGTEDVFANFRASVAVGVEPEIGLMMRCMDKFQRVRSFVTTGKLAVKSEPVADAVLDVINYMVLLAGLLEERGATIIEPEPVQQSIPGLELQSCSRNVSEIAASGEMTGVPPLAIDAVLQALQTGPVWRGIPSLADAIGMSPAEVSQRISSLVTQGIVASRVTPGDPAPMYAATKRMVADMRSRAPS